MNDFPIAFCKAPFVYEIYQWISFENSTTGKEDSKTKFYFEKVPIMRLHSAIVFFSNVPFLKFLLIHLLSMKLTPLQQTFIHPWRDLIFHCARQMVMQNSLLKKNAEVACRQGGFRQ